MPDVSRTADEKPPEEVKAAQRAELKALAPDEAQAVVETVLYPRLWRLVDPQQLDWPGDLADE